MGGRTVIGLAALLALAPCLAHAQPSDVGSARLGAYLALGLGGELESTTSVLGGTSGEADLDPTVGFGVRAEVPLHTFFAVGGLFELLTFEADGWDERESAFNIDVWAKGRYPIELEGDVLLEPYLGVPFGLTLAVLADPAESSDDEAWPGFNVGVLAGLAILVQERFGGFIEAGWRHHEVFNEANTVLGDVDVHLTADQFALHIGGLIAF